MQPGIPMMEAPPSKWPTVIGIIAIVIAALGLLANACGVVSLFFAGTMFRRTVLPGMPPELFQIRPGLVVIQLVRFAMAVALLIIGIGLLQRRPRSARWVNPWAVLAIVVSVIGGYIEFRAQQDNFAIMATHGGMPPGGPGPGFGFFMGFAAAGAVFNAVLRCAFPVFLLVWFARRKIKEEVSTWRTTSQ
jgi:hypothetical protein